MSSAKCTIYFDIQKSSKLQNIQKKAGKKRTFLLEPVTIRSGRGPKAEIHIGR